MMRSIACAVGVLGVVVVAHNGPTPLEKRLKAWAHNNPGDVHANQILGKHEGKADSSVGDVFFSQTRYLEEYSYGYVDGVVDGDWSVHIKIANMAEASLDLIGADFCYTSDSFEDCDSNIALRDYSYEYGTGPEGYGDFDGYGHPWDQDQIDAWVVEQNGEVSFSISEPSVSLKLYFKAGDGSSLESDVNTLLITSRIGEDYSEEHSESQYTMYSSVTYISPGSDYEFDYSGSMTMTSAVVTEGAMNLDIIASTPYTATGVTTGTSYSYSSDSYEYIVEEAEL